MIPCARQVYLGMDPKEDVDLLWIADEALTAGEPEGWSEMQARSGRRAKC